MTDEPAWSRVGGPAPAPCCRRQLDPRLADSRMLLPRCPPADPKTQAKIKEGQCFNAEVRSSSRHPLRCLHPSAAEPPEGSSPRLAERRVGCRLGTAARRAPPPASRQPPHLPSPLLTHPPAATLQVLLRPPGYSGRGPQPTLELEAPKGGVGNIWVAMNDPMGKPAVPKSTKETAWRTADFSKDCQEGEDGCLRWYKVRACRPAGRGAARQGAGGAGSAGARAEGERPHHTRQPLADGLLLLPCAGQGPDRGLCVRRHRVSAPPMAPHTLAPPA